MFPFFPFHLLIEQKQEETKKEPTDFEILISLPILIILYAILMLCR